MMLVPNGDEAMKLHRRLRLRQRSIIAQTISLNMSGCSSIIMRPVSSWITWLTDADLTHSGTFHPDADLSFLQQASGSAFHWR